jgi:serine/threonine protein kinase
MRVLGQVQCIIGGICVCFTLHFAWTVVTMYLTLSHNDGRPNTQPTIFSQPQVEQLEVEHEKRYMTTTLRGSSSLDKAKQAETSTIGSFGKVVRPPAIPKPIHLYGKTTSWTTREPDYGGLLISPLLAPGVPRVIRDGKANADLGDDDGQESESFDEYYAFDDDIIRGTDGVAERRYQDDDCRRTQEHRYTFPNCNEFHQLDRTNVENDFRFINDGAFREVFSLQTPQDLLAIKEIIFEDVGDEDEYALLEYVRMDAIVAERLTASPRVYDIYGHCALSIASEYFYHGDIEDLSAGEVGFSGSSDEGEHGDELRPNNGLTPAQKLVLALEMAESLADLHGNAAGLIIHDDVQLSQFLLNKDKTILKLNDFNRAEFPLWNGKAYCRYQNGRGPGKLLPMDDHSVALGIFFCLTDTISSCCVTDRCRFLEIARRIQRSTID